jgi:superfamily I DNA/RNA helicase
MYDAVLIDEAQDFAPSWFRCALAVMKDPLDGDLVIVSDGNQGLYRRAGISWQSLGVRARGRTYHKSFDLDTNYRNTREIVALAKHFASTSTANEDEGIACVPVDPAKARRSIGIRPVLFQERFRSAECNRAIALVSNLMAGKFLEYDLPHPLKGHEIGILLPPIPEQQRNELNHFLANLEELGPVVYLTPPHGRDARGRVNEPGIKVQSIHSAKGLEYRAVIVLWADLLPRDYREDYDEESDRRLMYVALTRSTDFLAITHSRPSAFIEVIRQSGAADLRR